VTSLEQQTLELKDAPGRLDTLTLQFQQLREETRNEVSSIRRECKVADEETRVLMRILHEDALARIKTMREGDDASREGE
jgi:hypothetical protein